MFFNYPTFELNMPLEKPPTLYSIMNSIVNYNSSEKISVTNLSEKARDQIFDFNYPLSEKINKSDFEIMILDHFIMRRIGTETFTAFKLNLKNKLNTIMPNYNVLFDNMTEINILQGDTIERNYSENYSNEVSENGSDVTTNESTGSNNNASTNNISNNNTTNANTSNSDVLNKTEKNSDTPQSFIDNNFDSGYVNNIKVSENSENGTTTTESTSNDTTEENTTSNGSFNNTTQIDTTRNNNNSSTGNKSSSEKITNSNGNISTHIQEFLQLPVIMDNIYKELDILFYQVI